MLLLRPSSRLRRKLGTSPLFLWQLVSVLGCAASSESPPQEDLGSGGLGGSTSEIIDTTIEFDAPSPLTLAPGEIETLTVVVTPSRNQTVTFEILTDSPQFDGFLLGAMSRVDDNGRASTEIQAPTTPSTFILRASIDGEEEARIPISVSDPGYATLNVTPVYAGSRVIEQWVASIHVGKTCDELETFFDDGSISAQGEDSVVLRAVPSAAVAAVTLRGDELTSGCQSVLELTADTEQELSIEVMDRPLQVAAGELELSLSVGSTTTAFAAHLENAIQTGLLHFRGEETQDAPVLLRQMEDLLGESDLNDFLEAQIEFGFESALTDLWTSESPLSSKLDAILTNAAAAINGQDVFVGKLHLEGENSSFLLTSAAGVPIAVSGFFEGSSWAISIESGDTFVLGGSLTYEPLRWLVAVAERTSLASPTEQLTEAAQCSAIAELFGTLAEGDPYSGCDTGCLASLCSEALTEIWDQQSTAGNDLLTTLQIGITGTASAGGAALIESIEGAWVGRFDGEESSIGGPMSGVRDPNLD